MITCLITGAGSGIGKAAAKLLALEGYHLVLIDSSEEKLESVKNEIGHVVNSPLIDSYKVDLSLQHEIRSFCIEFNHRFQKLDVLLNNAGVNLPFRRITPEGHEYMFAVNHLAPFLITNLLIECLRKSINTRIITIGSSAEKYAKLDFMNLQGEKSFNGMKQYSLTKLCNLMFTYELARKIKDGEVAVCCLHPGGVRTEIMKNYGLNSLPKMIWYLLYPFLQTTEKAAGYISALIHTDHSSIHGQYFFKGKRAKSSTVSMNENLARELWKYSANITGIK